MQHRLSSFKLAIGLIFSAALFSMAPNVSFAESWDSAHSTTASKSKTKAMKRAKTTKSASRAQASTAANGRYLAQNDLESDLDADLESELGAGETAVEPSVTEPVATTLGEDVQILDIQYDSKKGGGTVIISTTGAATYRTREIPAQNQVVVEIANAKLPERLKRPFNTKDFKQSIVSLNAYQEAGSNTARVVLQFRQPRSVDVRQNGKVLTVVASDGAGGGGGSSASNGGASGSAAKPNPALAQNSKSDDFGDQEDESAALDNESLEAESETGAVSGSRGNQAASDEPRGQRSLPAGSGKILPSSSIDQERTGDVRFYGKPISIEVRDTPVRDVVTLISDQSGANIIMSDDVQGNITIKLRQVPWDQALSIIMKTRGLGYVRQNGVLRIAPLRQLQAEVEEARRILDAQDATLPLRVKVIPVSFANVTLLATQIRNTLQGATASAAPAAAGVAPTTRGRIEADPRSSSLIVTDTEDNVKRIEQLVKALDTAPLQVMIEGKIVEAKEGTERRLGINWGYQGQDLGFAGGTLGHSAQITPTIGSPNATTIDLKLGTLDFLGDLTAKLSLFESESIARIISSPRVITMNNQRATIQQSVQIPVPTSTQPVAGVQPTVTTSFKDIPTVLAVTPQITAGGDVLMNISFQRQFQSGAGGASQPIDSRDIQTNVMVKNGQTTVIGGIYQADTSEGEEGTPYLRNIPVLGWLFKSSTKNSVRNELLVFITPRILNADRTLPKAGVVQ